MSYQLCCYFFENAVLWIFPVLSRTAKAFVVHSFVSVASLFSLSIYVSFFPPFFSASKKCDFGKTRARSCWWIVTGIILQENIFRNKCLNFSNTLIFHSWPVLPKIQIPRQHWLGTVMTIHYLMVLVSISQPFYLYFSKKQNIFTIHFTLILIKIVTWPQTYVTGKFKRILDLFINSL